MWKPGMIPAVLLLAILPAMVRADAKSRAATEAAEALIARFGSKAGKNVPTLAGKIEGFAARHGDDAIAAVRKVGPGAFALVEQAGADAPRAVQVLARYGEAGATRVVSRPTAMAQVVKYGDSAATALVKHPGVAEGMIERGGASAVKALEVVTPRNGRRLAMVLEGDLAKAGKNAEVLDVIAKYGNPAADFVWENKGALAVGTALTAFLLHPEPFISGAKDITQVAGEAVLKPLAEVPGQAVKGIAAGTNWTVVILVVIGGGVLFVLARKGFFALLPPRPAETVAAEPTAAVTDTSQPTSEDRK